MAAARITLLFAPVNPTTTNGIYAAGFGKDVITDFTANMNNISHDVLELSSSMFLPGTTAAALVNGTAHNAANGVVTVAQSGANVVITVDPTDTITLNNASLSVLKTQRRSGHPFRMTVDQAGLALARRRLPVYSPVPEG